ncbi:MAG: prepilin-type N-terminal cleavage/methylation domain-containing protein [Methylococcaceae bacterium]|nr:prepilin-type N-terminal cleavage/methylation domain-containing protein [Methylococcaceae bacterium]
MNIQAQGQRPKAKGFFCYRLAPSVVQPNQGFTLIELMVVLFIVVLGFSAIGIALSSGNDSTEHKSVARDIVSALRYARGHALLSHQEATVTFDLAENSYTVSEQDKIYPIPQTIDVSLVTGQKELSGEGQGSIRFFADGSSSGGRITLERAGRAWKIDINWLTGLIELEEKDASD